MAMSVVTAPTNNVTSHRGQPGVTACRARPAR